MSLRQYITLPKCPVCLRRYSKDVKPMVLMPCSHGICKHCVDEYRKMTEEDDEGEIKCPKCREPVIEEKPNYDLMDAMPQESSANYWAQKLVNSYESAGISINMHETVEALSKLILSRIANDARIQSISHKTRAEWLDSDIKLVKSMKQDFVDCIVNLDMSFRDATSWIQVLNLPPSFENYFTTQAVVVFENKRFLNQFEASWLLDLIPTSV